MKKGGQKKGNYNVNQVRMYTVRDELAIKENYTTLEKAKEVILQYFKDEHYGPVYSRGVIRCLHIPIQGWIVPTAFDNPKALLLDPGETAVEEWKLTLYDMGDSIIESATFKEAISQATAAAIMLNKNAFYSVISAREIGAQFFTITSIEKNLCFNLSVSSPKSKSNNLALTFAKTLAQDRAETERILEARRLHEQEL